MQLRNFARWDASNASMEPRFFNRGNFTVGSPSFNNMFASMEPRFFNRGNGRLTTRCIMSGMPQWSLDFSIEEIKNACYQDITGTGLNGASIFQSRKCCFCSRRSLEYHASMEPRFFNRGNLGTICWQIASL